MASDAMEEGLEDAAAALSAASRKVAPFLRNISKQVAASDARAGSVSVQGFQGWETSSAARSFPQAQMAHREVDPPVQSQRGRISQRVQGALRAHALRSEGAAPGAPAGAALPMPSMVSAERGQLRQAKEVIASVDTCGDPTVMERWIHHLDGSVHPMREAEKIMGMLRSLVRQGFCTGIGGQVNRSSGFGRLHNISEINPTTENSGWPPVQTSSPHGSLSRGILATAPNTQAGREGLGANPAQSTEARNLHALAKTLADNGLDPRSVLDGFSEMPAHDAGMLSMLRHLKEVGESSRRSV